LTNEAAAKQYGIPIKLVALLRSLPNYDPFHLAQPGDYFDVDIAENVVELFEEHIKHPEGPLVGKPFKLEGWQEATLLNFYGWRKPDGSRRYNECLIYIGKKNGKTTFSAGWLAIELRYLSSFGAQFYSAAASRDQAALVFNCIAKMLNFDKDLAAGLNVYGASGAGTSRSIARPETMSSYKCMSKEANTGDGVSPDFLLIDELHRHKDGELTETLEKSTAAKPSAIIIKTTTADYDRPSVCNRTVAYGRSVCANDGNRNKPGYDPALLPVIFEISPAEYKADPECWKKPETWRKANPNIGVSVPESFYEREVQKCMDDPALLNNFLRLHLNIVTEQSEIWIPMDKWDSCLPGRDDEQLHNTQCWAGFDLSATQDLTSLALCFKHPDGGYDMRWWFWIPGDNIDNREKKDGVPYRVWQTDGHIELIPGEVIDIEVVQDRIVSILNDYHVQTIGADPWNNSATMQHLINRGFNVKVFRQGPASITEPGKEMMRRIIEGTLRHNRNPIARWNASNAMIKNAPNETFSLDKDRAERRIDGIAAAIMSIGCAMEEVQKESAYAQGGVIWGGG
jgi:phage terminase large subunit-like protein